MIVPHASIELGSCIFYFHYSLKNPIMNHVDLSSVVTFTCYTTYLMLRISIMHQNMDNPADCKLVNLRMYNPGPSSVKCSNMSKKIHFKWGIFLFSSLGGMNYRNPKRPCIITFFFFLVFSLSRHNKSCLLMITTSFSQYNKSCFLVITTSSVYAAREHVLEGAKM